VIAILAKDYRVSMLEGDKAGDTHKYNKTMVQVIPQDHATAAAAAVASSSSAAAATHLNDPGESSGGSASENDAADMDHATFVADIWPDGL